MYLSLSRVGFRLTSLHLLLFQVCLKLLKTFKQSNYLFAFSMIHILHRTLEDFQTIQLPFCFLHDTHPSSQPPTFMIHILHRTLEDFQTIQLPFCFLHDTHPSSQPFLSICEPPFRLVPLLILISFKTSIFSAALLSVLPAVNQSFAVQPSIHQSLTLFISFVVPFSIFLFLSLPTGFLI